MVLKTRRFEHIIKPTVNQSRLVLLLYTCRVSVACPASFTNTYAHDEGQRIPTHTFLQKQIPSDLLPVNTAARTAYKSGLKCRYQED